MTNRPTRASAGGRAYLDLRKAASSAGRATDELLQLYALEGLLGGPPIQIRGYRIELVLAEKIVTAIQRGTANTRWRDFVDIASLARHDVDTTVLVESIRRVAAHRQTSIRPLADVLSGYPQIAQPRWGAWRRKQRLTDTTPAQFEELFDAVIRFADPLLERAASGE